MNKIDHLNKMKRSDEMDIIGIIGAGQMGGALLKGLIESGFSAPDSVYVSGGRGGTAALLQKELHFNLCQSNSEVAEKADILILAVTPQIMPTVLNEIKDAIVPGTLLISLAAGMVFNEYTKLLNEKIKLVRAIPNTPVSIQAGMTALSYNEQIGSSERDKVETLFQAVGEVIEVSETQLNSAGTVSGCSPAFIAIFIEALADGGVLNGLSRKQAYLLAEQAVLGTAKLALLSGDHPGLLKDDVCSPGGSTIKGVVALEQFGFRNAVIQAIDAAAKN